MKSIDMEGAKKLFKTIDAELQQRNKKIEITLLGGLAIILQGFRSRSTLDIDIAPTRDASLFKEICERIKIPVDIITVATTVDLVHAQTLNVFSGNFLKINSVMSEDLIKLKLERFYKQDPDDIFAIIDHLAMTYETFKNIVQDMLKDFIGNPKGPFLSALQVVEVKFPKDADVFEKEIKI
ncbi:MAG: DUF6036 family nucleotidyltransferase [Deltaproteobacteria bacterium]|nr:DUF6036 family nucleotidyltransferase [Deltaproteobacteria bacterium]